MFFPAFLYFEDLEIIQPQNRKPKNINRKPHNKVTKLKSEFSLILGQLNQALNNPAHKLRFYAWLNLFSITQLVTNANPAF